MYPFTIILKKVVDAAPVPLTLKIDPGSKVTGLALLMGTKLIWVAELTHRGAAIKALLYSRHAVRRNRRSRKTRYRPARFLNRTKPKGWLPPSLMHRVHTTMTWVNRLSKVAPIGTIYGELVRFDMQKMDNPEISGIEYQQGELAGYEVREYLLNKWDRKCAYCSIENVPLQVEHIQPRAKGGTDRVSNLCIACEKCNTKKGTQDIRVFLSKKPEVLKKVLAQAKRPLKDAAVVNSTRWRLYDSLKATGKVVVTGSGGMTKYNRVRLGLPKTHYYDAACVGSTPELIVLADQPLNIKAMGHGTRQMCRTDKYGFPCKHVPRFKFVHGYQSGDIVKAVLIKGKYIGTHLGRIAVRSSGSFDVSTVKGLITSNHKYCRVVHKKDGYKYNQG
jgi:5-methylcytosine-specific restriction endonuclease McrA